MNCNTTHYRANSSSVPGDPTFFRLGDFYELFFDDALKASEALGITLTSRAKGDDRVPMCGVPHHAARGHLAKLLEHGFKVAICDQVEEPGKSALVRREVTRIVTPGTVLDDGALDPREPSYVGAVALRQGPEPGAPGPSRHELGRGGGFALLDLSTGELRAGEAADDARLADELRRAGVRELVLSRDDAASARGERLCAAVRVPLAERDPETFARPAERLRRHLKVASLDGFGVGDLTEGLAAAAGALAYAEETQRSAAVHVDRMARVATEAVLHLDEATRANLELERTLSGGRRKGSLLGLLDRSVTGAGSRRLTAWLRWPLVDRAEIERRLDAVERLAGSAVLREELAAALRPVGDIERLLSRLALGQGTGRDLRALAGALLALPALQSVLHGAVRPADPQGQLGTGAARPSEAGGAVPPLLAEAADGLAGLEGLAAELDRAVAEDPPATRAEPGLIRRGWSAELDEVVGLAEDARGTIARMEAEERSRTGIGSLKVRYNRVFGYYLEVTKPNLHLVPADWQRRQTTVGGERFVTEALKTFEEKVLGADERRLALEARLFEELRARVVAAGPALRSAADAVATADALLALARVAAERGYVRPDIDDAEALVVEDGRHPVVEAMLPSDSGGFVPNDLAVRSAAEAGGPEPGGRALPQVVVLTGPNMAGKSTVLRQAALICLLAQMGSFVPARRARVGLVDRIFTRVGASDDLARGRSTFMVEMTETAAILHNATRRSLVVLDEIGRGTSTFDGVSIAWAVAEFLHDRLGCRTLFATHYHELQDLARERPRVANLTVAVRELGDTVVFLRKLVQGGASRSYGIEVAKLAGLPGPVVARAREILKNLERLEVDEGGHAALARLPVGEAGDRRRGGRGARPETQLGLFGAPPDPEAARLRRELQELDLDRLRPLDALNLLAAWKERMGPAGGG